MAGKPSSERTEKPTPKRRGEARRKGQIARSPELLGWVVLLVGSEEVPAMVRKGYAMCSTLMFQAGSAMAHPGSGTDLTILGDGLRGVWSVGGPFIVAMMVLGVVGNLAQVGFAPTLYPLRPKFSHLNPATGLKRLASPQSAWSTAKTVIRVGLLALIGWTTIHSAIPAIIGRGGMSLTSVAGLAASRGLGEVRTMAVVNIGIAAVDYGLQRRRIAKAMRMSKQEIKDEARESDGNPQMKAAIRRRQRAMSRYRMIAAVAGADAVVVNPTHVAVAIAYTPGRGAPRVVAKGADEVAARIRLEAEIHGVPLVADVALARAMYAVCELEAEIPRDLYEAVARLLTFIYTLRATGHLVRTGGGAHRPPAPLLVG